MMILFLKLNNSYTVQQIPRKIKHGICCTVIGPKNKEADNKHHFRTNDLK